MVHFFVLFVNLLLDKNEEKINILKKNSLQENENDKGKEKSKIYLYLLVVFSIERDAQLLANRIALLKQEEMKTWKKIEETKKRTGEITTLKKRNEDKIQKVIPPFLFIIVL